MGMASNKGEPHIWPDTETLVDLSRSLHACRRADRTEPVDVVLDDKETARCDQGGKEVVIFRDGAGLACNRVELW